MSRFEYLLEQQVRRRRLRGSRPRVVTAYDRRSEWSARPLGRLGRLLLQEIEGYLDFYTIVRAAENVPGADRGMPAAPRDGLSVDSTAQQ